MPRNKGVLAAVAVLAVVVLGGVVMIVNAMTGRGHPASAAGASGRQAAGAALCNSQRLAVDGGLYTVQNNEWGSGAPECMAVGGTGSFTVTRSAIANSTNGAPGGYPSIIDIEAGFELWQGGAGLATESFAVNVPGSNSAPAAFQLNGTACKT